MQELTVKELMSIGRKGLEVITTTCTIHVLFILIIGLGHYSIIEVIILHLKKLSLASTASCHLTGWIS